MNAHIGVSSASPYGKTVEPVVSLCPPAIQHRKIQAAIQHYLLTTGPRCFQRTPRIVEPDIHPLDKVPAHVNVVIFYKYELVRKFQVTHQLGDLLQHTLARFVAWMCLARENELHRALGVIHHGGQFFNVRQN